MSERSFFSHQHSKSAEPIASFSGPLTERFFTQFGEPHEIEVRPDRNEVVLKYTDPIAQEKIASARSVFDSGHWTIAVPEGEDSIFYDPNQGVYVQVTFPQIPGLSYTALVISDIAAVNRVPSIQTELQRLPKEVHAVIGKYVREHMKTLDEYVEACASSIVSQPQWIEQVHALQALSLPGDPILHQSIRTPEKRKGYNSMGQIIEEDSQEESTDMNFSTFAYALQCGGSAYKDREREDDRRLSRTVLYNLPAKKSEESIQKYVSRIRELYMKKGKSVEEDVQRFFLLSDQFDVVGISHTEWNERFLTELHLELQRRKEQLEQINQVEFQRIVEHGAEYDTLQKELTMLQTQKRFLVQPAVLDVLMNDVRFRQLTEPSSPAQMYAPTFDQLQEYVADYRLYIQHLITLIQGIADSVGQFVFTSQTELEAALQKSPVAAQWYVAGVDTNDFIKYNLHKGWGIEGKVFGQDVYLPGDKQVVAISLGFRDRSSDVRQIRTSGITQLPGVDSSLPREVVFVGAIEDGADWSVSWIESGKRSEQYALANKKGITKISGYDQYWSVVSCVDWNGEQGVGPALEDVMQAHNIPLSVSQMSKVSQEARAQEVEPETSVMKGDSTTIDLFRQANIRMVVSVRPDGVFRLPENTLLQADTIGSAGRSIKFRSNETGCTAEVRSGKGKTLGDVASLPFGAYAISEDGKDFFTVSVNQSGQVTEVTSVQVYNRGGNF